MIHLAPFDDLSEHRTYCEKAQISFEEGSVGFKIFSDEEKLGLCQIKFVSEAAYILNLIAIEEKISVQMLANVFTSILTFLERVEIQSVIFPVQTEDDIFIAENTGFDRVSDTLYILDFVKEEICEDENCDCGHHHK